MAAKYKIKGRLINDVPYRAVIVRLVGESGPLTYCVCDSPDIHKVSYNVVLDSVNGHEIPDHVRVRAMQFEIREGLTLEDFELELT